MPFSATRDLWLVLKARDEGTRALKSFARDIRMVGDSVSQANLQAARSALRNQLAMQRMTGATKADQIATMDRIAAIDKEIGQSRIHRASLEESRVSAQKLSSALGGASAAMTAAGTAMVAAGALGAAGIKNMIDSAIEYEKQSNLTRTQVDKFSASLKTIEDIGLRVANKIGVPFKDIQPALFDIFSSLEIGTKDAERLLEIFSKAAVAGQTDIQSASRATIGIMNAFQLPLTSVNHLMDLQFQLVQEGIGTYEEWTQRIGLVSPSAVRAGQSVETMVAALAATTRMGVSAARSGTAVARAFDAMSNPAAVKAMKNLGVEALDSSGKFRPIIDVLTDFRTVLMKLPEAERIKTLLAVFKGAGGTIEARRFLQNMLLTPGNLELFKNIFDEMSNTAGSFEQAYSIMADSAATKSELLANKWETLKIKVGEALIPSFLSVVDVLGKVFDWFNKLDPRTQRIIAITLGLATGVSILGGALLLILGVIAAFVAAIVVAGTSLLIVVGVLAGATAGFVAFGAAVGIAWAKSSQFRDIIRETGKDFKDLKDNYIIPTAQAISAAWNQYMGPALQALNDIISHKVMPAFRDFTTFLRGEYISSFKEIGNNIKDFLIFAFRQLATIIKKDVIPAIAIVTKYYRDHEGTIKQIVHWLVIFVKWAIKIGLILTAVLAVALAGPVVGAILAFTASMAGAIIAIIAVVDTIKDLISWFGDETPKAVSATGNFFKNTWQDISDFFVNTWNDIASFFTGLWQDITDFFIGVWHGITDFLSSAWDVIVAIFEGAADVISSIWHYFWGTAMGRFVQAVLELIVALIKLAFFAILFVFEWAIALLIAAWMYLWNTVKNFLIEVWNFIGPYLKTAWDAIASTAITVWTAIADFFVMIWNGISSYLVMLWDAIVALAVLIWTILADFFTGFWNGVKSIFMAVWDQIWAFLRNRWNIIISVASATWNTFYAVVANALTKTWDNIRYVMGVIKDFFVNAVTWLYDAGRNLIQGLVNGITSKIKDVTGAIENITQKIRDHLPFSPAKIGPLSGSGNPYLAGQKIVKMVADGMASKVLMLNGASSLMASAAGVSVPSVTGTDGAGRTYNQQIVVNTHEIDPRRHAAELGFLLAGSL